MLLMGLLAVILAIYLTAIISVLVLNKLSGANRPGVSLLLGGAIALIVAALEAPWYVERVWGVSGRNILRITGAIVAAAIPIMVALVVQSTAKRYPTVLAILAGAIAIPLGLFAYAVFACMQGCDFI
jgi:hypothetical protein